MQVESQPYKLHQATEAPASSSSAPVPSASHSSPQKPPLPKTQQPSTDAKQHNPNTGGRLSHGIVPDIQNVVATTNLDVKLDLKKIALRARNAEYNPKRFAAVIMRIREPKTTALIFSSGKIVVTGAKSERESSRASRKYAKIVHKLGYDDAKFKEFTVQNIVASCDVNFPVRLEGLAHAHSQFCSYEPELFPGLIYRMIKPKIVLLIFVSGKVVLTGAKVRADIYEAFDNIYHVLQTFRKARN